MRWILIFSWVGLFGLSQAKSDFSIERDQLKRRYEDFYLRVQEKKRKDLMRQNWAKEHKKNRQEREEEYNTMRRLFVRPKPEDRENQRLLHEKLVRKKGRVREKLRLEHIRQRNRLTKIRESSMKIPPEKDAGLEEL